MLSPTQLREMVVRPALQTITLWSQDAEDLVVRTGVQESRLTYLAQSGGGPARGLWQMEKPTFDDLWVRFCGLHPELAAHVHTLIAPGIAPFDQLPGNLLFAAAMCRIKYFSCPDPIPESLMAQADYWKKWYNTTAGAGTTAEFINNCRQAGVF